MPSTTLRSLALVSSLGALTACPTDSPPHDTEDFTTGGSSSGSGGPSDPTEVNPTTTNTTPPDPTSGGTDTGSTEPDITSGDPTVDPSTTGTSDTSGDDTTTGGASNLCTRLGGMADDGIPALVNGFLGKVLVDEKMNGYFLNSDVDAGALGTCVINQVGALAGCEGVVYECKDMKSAHMGLGISQADFDDFVMDFVAAYDEHVAAHPDLTDDDKTTIGGALGGMATDIVEDPTSDATVYQRVGRKPAIKALIGHPGEMGSFVDNVAMDPAIAGFFMMSDFERLNTCLTRQVASIDGPIKYGAEVTAPDGIDPGVAVDTPCRTMRPAPAALMDDLISPTTIDDFMALVADLVTAMTTAGVSDADQTAILSVLGPMCDDIVADPNMCPGNSKIELVEADMINIAIDSLGDKWDDKYNGNPSTMLCTDLVLADDALNFVNDVSLKMGIDHTFLGDLTIKIIAPDKKLFTPLSRAGLEPNQPLKDDGVACCGDNSNLAATSPFTLSDKAVIPAQEMGKTLDSTKTVCKDENPAINPCAFKPYHGLAPGNAFSDFKGSMVPGTWKVCVGDSGKGDFGKLQYVGLTFERVKYAPK